MEKKKRINIEAEKLLLYKQKDIFLKEIGEIIKKLSYSEDKSIKSRNDITTRIDVNLGETLTRSFGQNCIQINKLGDILLLLASGWNIKIKEEKNFFSVVIISPSHKKIKFQLHKKNYFDLIISFTLDFQKLLFIPLSSVRVIIALVYSLGFRFTSVFNLLLQSFLSRRLLIKSHSSFLQEDFIPDDHWKDMNMAPITLELGKELINLMSPKTKKQFLDRITSIRKHIVLDMGIILPTIRVKDNFGLNNRELLLTIKDNTVATGEIYLKRTLAIGPESYIQKLRGKKVLEPTYHMPGVWITDDQRGEAERTGCMLFDPISVIATLMTEVMRKYAHVFLGIQETEELLSRSLREYPAVRKELEKVISIIELNKILKNLLYEQVSIRDLVTICETIIEYSSVSRHPDILSEYARQSLRNTICAELKTIEGNLYIALVDPNIESFLLASIRKNDKENTIIIKQAIKDKLFEAINNQNESFKNKGLKTIILCSPKLRLYFRRFIEENFSSIIVLSYNEIASQVNPKPVGIISLEDNLLKYCNPAVLENLFKEIEQMRF